MTDIKYIYKTKQKTRFLDIVLFAEKFRVIEVAHKSL